MIRAGPLERPGKGWWSLLIGFAAVCLLFAAMAATADDSDPSPSPLFEQSLNGSFDKFHSRDRGGGTPVSLAERRIDQPVATLEAISSLNSGSIVLPNQFVKPAGAQPGPLSRCFWRVCCGLAPSRCISRPVRRDSIPTDFSSFLKSKPI